MEQLINHIEAGNLNKANAEFETIMKSKAMDVIDQKRVEVASTMFQPKTEQE